MENNKTDNLSLPFYENLTGLRFIGALSVFLFHSFTLGREVWGDFFHHPIFTGVFKLLSKGHHGVGLFFVLSGFLITSLLLNEANQNGQINAFNFFMRRLLRIWPLYFLVLFFGFILFPLLPQGIETKNSLFHYIIFLSNFEEIWSGWRDSISFLTVTWSVSIEEQFYMTWVALITLIPAIQKGKYYSVYFVLLILVSILFRALHIDDERIIYFHTLSVISDLAIGGLLALVVIKTNWLTHFSKLSKFKLVITYLVGGAILLLSPTIFKGYLISIERLYIGLFFAFIIFEQVYCTHSFYKADKILGFFKLGKISYGLYMYHCIVIYFTQNIMVHYGFQDSILGFIAFLFLAGYITLIISRLSYTYIESPILKLKKHFR
ncbi:MAG: acyltransferase [Crocinitomicaceae bacterium]|nr:acyltransferase [Crocinitomicaceae bacterium]MDG1776883.1 acyltransferase [Crocinitomicaceae bacterium]